MSWITMMRVVTHLQPDVLQCEVKWALGSITTNKAGGGDGLPIELVRILKADAVKSLHSTCQQMWKMQQWPQDWKRSVFILIPKKSNAKECSNYHSIALISHVATKICSKSFKLSFSSTCTKKFQIYRLSFEEAEEPRITSLIFLGSWRKQRSYK